MTRSRSIVLLTVVVAMAALTHWVPLATVQVINGPDIKIHYRWALQFAAALSEGVYYPRWAAYSYFGLGDPTFLYIHPLFYYAVAVFDGFVGNVWLSILGVGALSTCVASVATFWIARRHTTDLLAILAAGVVALSPYAFHLAHYQQFLPMHFAMPMLVLFVGAVCTSSDRFRIPATALSLCLLVGSHILAAFMALICTGVLILWRAYQERADARQLLLHHGVGVALGLGMSSVYLFPAMTAQNLVSPAGWYAPIHLDWRNAFLFQYFTLPEFGFRWFHLQWTIPMLTLLACGASGCILWIKKANRGLVWRRSCEILLLAVVALVLGSEICYPIWGKLEILRRIQFPLRFLQISSVASVLALVWSASLLSRKNTALIIVGGFLLASTAMLGALQRQYAIEAKPALSIAAPGQAVAGQPEMKPAGVGEGWRRYKNQDAWQADCRAVEATCLQTVSKTHHKVWVVDLPKGETKSLRIPVFAFPGWRYLVNDKVVAPEVDSDTGLPLILLSPGHTTVEAIWVGVPQERVGLAISLASLIVLGALVIAGNRRPFWKGATHVA